MGALPFNGMEKDGEFTGSQSHYDFGARILDTRIGRWLSVDPYFAMYPDYSAYAFGLDNPIYWIDRDGNSVKATPSFNNNVGAKQALTLAKKSSLFNKTLNRYRSANYYWSITFHTKVMPSNGLTTGGTSGKNYIILNSNRIGKASEIAIVRTLAHELIHVELFRNKSDFQKIFDKELEESGNPAQALKVAKAAFPALGDKFNASNSKFDEGYQHEIMASRAIRGKIATVLKEVDANQNISRGGKVKIVLTEFDVVGEKVVINNFSTEINFTPEDYYDAMSWGGLTSTKAFEELRKNDPMKAVFIKAVLGTEEAGGDFEIEYTNSLSEFESNDVKIDTSEFDKEVEPYDMGGTEIIITPDSTKEK